MEITKERRIFAQQILIVAIDSSYAVGFVKQLLGMLSPQRAFTGLAIMGGKLAAHYMKHWWKYAKQDDLKKPRVAEVVRARVALNYKTPAEDVTGETASARSTLKPIYLAATMTTFLG